MPRRRDPIAEAHQRLRDLRNELDKEERLHLELRRQNEAYRSLIDKIVGQFDEPVSGELRAKILAFVEGRR
jgi:hypothetical protein